MIYLVILLSFCCVIVSLHKIFFSIAKLYDHTDTSAESDLLSRSTRCSKNASLLKAFLNEFPQWNSSVSSLNQVERLNILLPLQVDIVKLHQSKAMVCGANLIL